jgi:putative phosphoribosyl transferase
MREDAPVVVGLPRGGVPVAFEVAWALGARLDVLLVRKLGLPAHPELAMGAVGEGGVRVLNPEILRSGRVTEAELAAELAAEQEAIRRQAVRFRQGRPAAALTDRTVIIVDDGIATGSTALAAIAVAREHGARRVVVAAPVAAPETVRQLREHADEVVCVETPERFAAVGYWYADFSATTDDEVVDLLERAARRAVDHDQPSSVRVEELELGRLGLPGSLVVPAGAQGIVLFVHGSGSTRHSPRNQFVAGVLQQAGIATVLFDLLTPREAEDRRLVFDIPFLAQRLVGATETVRQDRDLRGLPLGYFGASTGAGAALWAAAEPAAPVRAVVSRGGRPDLAMARLPHVVAPTLLIVGSEDREVLALNRAAARSLRCPHRLEVVPGASHLFEEPGTLAVAAGLAARWFEHFLAAGSGARHREAS